VSRLESRPRPRDQPGAAGRRTANALKLLPLSGDAGHGPTCCRLAPVANDPDRLFTTGNWRIAKGSFALDVGALAGETGVKLCDRGGTVKLWVLASALQSQAEPGEAQSRLWRAAKCYQPKWWNRRSGSAPRRTRRHERGRVYDAGGNSHPDSMTAITASVRLLTFNVLRMVVM
jgi:hypothetical protein